MIQDQERIIEKAKKDEKILAIILFGSYARSERHSDIDVCLVMKPDGYANLELSEKKLEFLIDVSDKFDIQVFQQLPIYIRIRILKEGKIIFCKNMDLLYDLAFQTVKEFEDFKPIYYGYLESVAHA